MSTQTQISKAPLARCWECPLAKEACALTTGPQDAKVALVSRSPGKWDVQHGKPFTGPSGKVLDYLLQQNGLSREQVITTNVVLCETDSPPDSAIRACSARLHSEIENAEVVIAAGTEAVKAFTGYKTLDASRGFSHQRTTDRGNTQRVVTTNNPAIVLRESDNFPNLVKDFKRAIHPLPRPILPQVTIVRNADKGRKILKDILVNPPPLLAADIEARGGTTHRTELACIGLSATGERSVVFGIECLSDNGVYDLLRKLLEGRTSLIWHNGKYDVKGLRFNGINANYSEDTYVLSLACDERPRVHALEYMLMDEFGWPDYEPESVKNFKKTGRTDNLDELYEYNGWDTAGTFQLHNLLKKRAEDDNVYKLYKEHLLPIYRSFVDVEMRGFHYAVEEAADLNENYVLPKLRELATELRQIAGLDLLNPNSPDQVAALLYDMWGLKHNMKELRKKDKSRSTDHDVRTEIISGRAKANPGYMPRMKKFAETMEVYSKINKQRGTYIEGLINRALSDGKLYTNFKFGTVTGRSSSEKPNFQNITRMGHYGIPSMRTLFKPSPGNVIVQADYSQAELRCIAKFTKEAVGDNKLYEIYLDNTRSLHKERALAFYGEGYNSDQYVQGKNMNFGITYGQGVDAFYQMYGIDKGVAKEYIEAWWRDFPEVEAWTEQIKKEVKVRGVIINPFGRKRRFQLITRENKGDVEREAVNFVPQSTASEFTLLSVAELNNNGVPIVATVHDSIVADVPVDSATAVAKEMKEVMEGMPMKTLGWDLPFLVDISIGPDWGSVKEVEL